LSLTSHYRNNLILLSWPRSLFGVDDDNSGNPPDDPPCDFDCQLQQAEQNALNALSNPDCAQAVDGGTGFAATALVQAMSGGDPSSPLYGSTASGVTMQGGDLGANIVTPNGFSGTGANTSPTFSYDTNDNGQLVNTGVNGAVITFNSNPNGEFLNPLPNPRVSPGYSTGALQTMDVLHELGHAADYNGYPSSILNDQGNSEQSMMNQDTVEQNCF
jgi:hypothetical protein